MSDRTLKYLVATVIAMLLIFQIGSFISSLYGMTWGVVAGLVIIGVLVLSARLTMSAGSHSFWFLLSLLLLTVFFTGLMIWRTITEKATWYDSVVSLAPFIIGFCAPVVLLLIVYYELRSRANH